MTPEIIALLIRFSIEFGIPATEKIIGLFEKKEVTVDDVRNAFKLAHTAYEEYEALPEGSTVPALPEGTAIPALPPKT